MALISVTQKRDLAERLAKLYDPRWGKAAMRRPYPDDDEDGGVGGLKLPEHPFLQDLPQGVTPPDLAADVNQHAQFDVEIENRASEASPELRKQPVVRAALAKGMGSSPKPSAPV